MAFNAAGAEDLTVIAAAQGASQVEAIDEPGGSPGALQLGMENPFEWRWDLDRVGVDLKVISAFEP